MRLCDWLFSAILLDRHVLDYAAAYFHLGPIERRIAPYAGAARLPPCARRRLAPVPRGTRRTRTLIATERAIAALIAGAVRVYEEICTLARLI